MNEWDAFPVASQSEWDAFPPASQVGIGEDVVKSAGGGLQAGLTSLAGAGGDVRETLASLVNRGSSALGYEIPKNVAADVLRVVGPAGLLAGPTSETAAKTVEQFVGPAYQPQTIPGKITKTAVEFAPAVIGGPEALATKAFTRVAAPAVGSVAAEEAGAGPLGQVGAAVASSMLAHRMVTPRNVPAQPEVQQLRDAATAGYRSPEVAAVEIRPAAVNRMADTIAADLNRSGQFDNIAPQTHRALDQLRNMGNTPGLPQGVATVTEIRAIRSNLSEISREVNNVGRPTPEAVAAGRAARRIDDAVANLRAPDLLAGNAQRANAIIREANANWAAASKAEDIGTRLTRAERQAARSGSGTNIENALRQKVSAVLDVPSRTVGLRPNEIAQAERVVRGTPINNALRKVGKLGFGDGLSLLMHAGAALPSGGLSIPVGIAGTAARMASERMTQRAANRLEEMIRQRSPEAQRWAAIQARINANRRAGLSAPQTGLLSGLFAGKSLLGL